MNVHKILRLGLALLGALVIVVITVFASDAFSQEIGQQNIPNQVLSVPSQVNVHKLKEIRVTPGTVAELVNSLGQKADVAAVKRVGELLVWENAEVSMLVYEKSGGFRYSAKSRLATTGMPNRPQFTNSRATEMAESFLNKAGWMPKDGTAYVDGVQQLKESAVDGQGTKVDDRVVDTEVIFRRRVDGINVQGPGGVIVVYLDNTGGVLGCYKLWREIEGVQQKVDTISGTAIENAKKQFAFAQQVNVVTKDLGFGYLEQGPGNAQKFLQPVYVIQATSSNQVSKSAISVFPAGSQVFEPVQLESPKRIDQRTPKK